MTLDPSELFPEVPNLYDFPSVHQYMIYDEHRVNAYRRAIERTVRPGDTVVDVGTGTGLLAFLCIQAGAARVHAIDRAHIIEKARQLAEANGWADRITFHHADARDAEIPERADVMVSELIGHMAFEEGMVETLSIAQETLLKPGGKVIPEKVSLSAAPVSEREVYASQIDGWRSAYGIDYSLMRKDAVKACYVTEIDERDLLASPQDILSIDFAGNGQPETRRELEFTLHRSGVVNGLAMWFDAVLAQDVLISSGPWSKTHWDQVFAPIPVPFAMNRGETLRAMVALRFRTREHDRFSVNVDLKKRRPQ